MDIETVNARQNETSEILRIETRVPLWQSWGHSRGPVSNGSTKTWKSIEISTDRRFGLWLEEKRHTREKFPFYAEEEYHIPLLAKKAWRLLGTYFKNCTMQLSSQTKPIIPLCTRLATRLSREFSCHRSCRIGEKCFRIAITSSGYRKIRDRAASLQFRVEVQSAADGGSAKQERNCEYREATNVLDLCGMYLSK
jgi:hypothetical protein